MATETTITQCTCIWWVGYIYSQLNAILDDYLQIKINKSGTCYDNYKKILTHKVLIKSFWAKNSDEIHNKIYEFKHLPTG